MAPGPTASAAASRAVSERRPSPAARRTRWARASSVSVTAPSRPRGSATARSSSVPTAASSRACRPSTRLRESRGATTEKLGFSVVAPTSSTTRSSTAASSASCCVREKRWISSMNSTVRRGSGAVSRRRATSMTPRTSFTPAFSALRASNARPVACEMSRASVVLPVPGGPCSTTEAGAAPSTRRRSGAPGPSRWSWPTTSSRLAGRIRTASGAATPDVGEGRSSTTPRVTGRSGSGPEGAATSGTSTSNSPFSLTPQNRNGRGRALPFGGKKTIAIMPTFPAKPLRLYRHGAQAPVARGEERSP